MKKQRHFDELQLINLVREQPAIYDRKSKDYRRPGITENAWSAIAEKLGVGKVEQVKKRWKSLRDAFIKYYRQELTTGKPFGNKKKTWPFYSHLSYLRNHVELLGLDNLEAPPVEPPELYDEAKSPGYNATTQQQQMINDVSLEFENDTEDQEEIEIIDDTEKIQKLLDEHNKQDRKSVEPKGGRGGYSSEHDTSNSMMFVADPDERYLLSCLPVLKRLSPQKNALIKLKIQQFLYEVEFEMSDDSQPIRKRKAN